MMPHNHAYRDGWVDGFVVGAAFAFTVFAVILMLFGGLHT